MRPIQRVLTLAAALCAAGCTSGLFQSQAPRNQLYVLAVAPTPASATSPTTGATGSLRVLRPLPAAGLDGDRLALQSGNRLDYYGGSRWGGPLPDVVADLVVQKLQHTGAWRTVTDARAPFGADWQLQLYIDHFEAVYPPGSDATAAESVPVATVSLHGVLVRRTDGTTINLAGSASQPAAANRLGSVVQAFDAAANEALAQVVAQAAPVAPAH